MGASAEPLIWHFRAGPLHSTGPAIPTPYRTACTAIVQSDRRLYITAVAGPGVKENGEMQRLPIVDVRELIEKMREVAAIYGYTEAYEKRITFDPVTGEKIKEHDWHVDLSPPEYEMDAGIPATIDPAREYPILWALSKMPKGEPEQ